MGGIRQPCTLLFGLLALTGTGAAGAGPPPLPLAGLLRPGPYAATYADHEVFKPKFTFTAGAGWLVGGIEAVGIELQDAKFASSDYLLVWNLGASCRVEGFGLPVPSPRQITASLASRPFVSAAKPRAARIGGFSGLAIEFTVASRPPPASKRPLCVTYLSTVISANPFRYVIWYVGSMHRLIALQVKREIVVFEIIASKDDFDRFAARAEALLRTVRWR